MPGLLYMILRKELHTVKKALSVILSLLFVFSVLPAAAARTAENMTVELFSDVAGASDRDVERFISVSEGLVPNNITGVPVSVYDCIGTPYFDKLKPGRSYTVYYSILPAEGYEFPDEVSLDNMTVKTAKGNTVYWCGKTHGLQDSEGVWRQSVEIQTTLRVDGNAFQMFFGRLVELFMKIRSWSPY